MAQFHQVYPPERVDPSFVRIVKEALPDLLFVFHPTARVWQVYRSTEGQWDAQRLWRAMQAYAEHGRDPEFQWWRWLGAPFRVGEFSTLGSYIVDEMQRRRIDNYPGGRERWYKDYEEQERQRELKMDEAASDYHHDVVYGGFYRHARDFRREDSLAGKRKWVHTVTKDLKHD